MSEHEDALRQAEQDRALDLYRPSGGAVIRHTPLDRYQEVVAVNRADLEYIRDFDGTSTIFGASGMFFLSGGSWLGIDKYSGWVDGPMPTIVSACACAAVVGLVLLLVSYIFGQKKKNHIARIFSETKPTSARR